MIDTMSHVVMGQITVGIAPTRVAITPDGRRAYVKNHDSNSVSVIDTATD